MLTSFGKFCRKLRIDNGELLKEMADKLGVTSSYLSAVENGKRNVPDKWRAILLEKYQLDEDQQADLNKAYQESINVNSIDVKGFNKEEKDLLVSLAREMDNIDEKDVIKIRSILKKSKV